MKREFYKNQNFVFAISFIAVLFLQLWKAKQGKGFSDEYYYITEGLRVVQGDALFTDNWAIAQLIGVFIAPLVKLYISVHGNTDGIVLFIRYCYVAQTMLVGLLIYLKFKKYGYQAIFASIIYLLFTPFSVMALSYNTMGPAFLIVALLLYPENGQSKARFFACGMFMAFVVLNNPYMIFLYVFLTIVMFINKRIVSFKSWLWISLGAFSIAAIFILFILSRASLKAVLSSLQYLVDDAHSTNFVRTFIRGCAILVYKYGICSILFAIEIIAVLFIRKKADYSKRNFMLASCFVSLFSTCYITLIQPYSIEYGGYSLILFPYALLGFFAMILFEQDRYLVSCYLASVFHAAMIAMSTNVGPTSYCGYLIFASTIAALFLKRCEIKFDYVTITLIGFLLFYKITSIYGGDSSFENAVKLKGGALEGLQCNESAADSYYLSLQDVNAINEMEEENVILITWNTWEYLSVNKRIATDRTYLYFYDTTQYTNAEDEYYLTHLERFPALMYVDYTTPYLSLDDAWLQQFEKIAELNKGVVYKRQ